MGFCSLPPDRVKLAVNSKKKQRARSKWAKGQVGLLLFTPWKSQNVLLLFTPWQSQTNWTARKKQRVGSNWAKRSQVGPGPFWLRDNRVKLGQKESSWAMPILTRSQIGQGVKMGRNREIISIAVPDWFKINRTCFSHVCTVKTRE